MSRRTNGEQAKSRLSFFVGILFLGLASYLLGISFFAYSWSPGPNYRNVTVDTKVNITGSVPVITDVLLPSSITLDAGVVTVIACNVSIRDYNGFGDIASVNATFYRSSVGENAADDNNTHYTNTSCINISGQQSGTFTNFTCTFGVNYYALNGTWNCTARVNDTTNLRGFGSNTTTINPLYALNITPTLIDYGNISQGDYSPNITANVSNLGNLNINISVFGYARTLGDNLSFVCDQGNFTVAVQHFAANSTAGFGIKQNLTGSYSAIAGLTINKTNNATYSLNSTYWEMYADPNQVASGNCTGSIVFQAGTS